MSKGTGLKTVVWELGSRRSELQGSGGGVKYVRMGVGCHLFSLRGEAEVPGEAAMGSKCMTPRSSVIPWDLCFRQLFVAD